MTEKRANYAKRRGSLLSKYLTGGTASMKALQLPSTTQDLISLPSHNSILPFQYTNQTETLSNEKVCCLFQLFLIFRSCQKGIDDCYRVGRGCRSYWMAYVLKIRWNAALLDRSTVFDSTRHKSKSTRVDPPTYALYAIRWRIMVHIYRENLFNIVGRSMACIRMLFGLALKEEMLKNGRKQYSGYLTLQKLLISLMKYVLRK